MRDALAMIARDEATHAELGWSVLAWCLDQRGVRAAVAARVARLDEQLAPQGVLDQVRIGEIAAAVIATAKLRALQLLDGHTLARAA